MESGDINQLPEELIQRFGNGIDLEGMMSSDIFQQGDIHVASNQDDASTSVTLDSEIIMHMDIREPLKTLQKLLEKKLAVSLKDYEFWLQDAQELEPHKNLVDQCVKGEGLVQINVEIKYIIKRINILDVLKPTEDALAALNAVENRQGYKTDSSSDNDEDVLQLKYSDQLVESETESKAKKFKSDLPSTSTNKKERPCLNWVLDSSFRKEQLRLKIPENPYDWAYPHVKYWFQWAVKEFNLINFTYNDWNITGRQLCSLSHEEFRKKLPTDPGNVFWTHIQLLKECKFVAIVHKAAESVMSTAMTSHIPKETVPDMWPMQREQKIMRKTFHNAKREAYSLVDPLSLTDGAHSTHGNGSIGSGNNGQVQLWQFLLEILTDREHANIIQWVGDDGEFKLTDPERVARLWGEKKNKPAMNYEKLSRALRYYYDGDMISKVSGKRFTYKFDCDLKLLIGYTASELSTLVNEKNNVTERTIDVSEDK